MEVFLFVNFVFFSDISSSRFIYLALSSAQLSVVMQAKQKKREKKKIKNYFSYEINFDILVFFHLCYKHAAKKKKKKRKQKREYFFVFFSAQGKCKRCLQVI